MCVCVCVCVQVEASLEAGMSQVGEKDSTRMAHLEARRRDREVRAPACLPGLLSSG